MRLVLPLLVTTMLYACSEQVVVDGQGSTAVVESDQPLVDSFVMRNAEIREDILKQLGLKGVEHWENEDGSIGFNVVDTKQVDQIANEAIGVYISLQ